MCGIAGIAGLAPPAEARLARMLEALVHRGPDGEGRILGARAALGHRRLAIIDLEGGRQPLFNADRSLWLVCNGEIYNYRELRAELLERGYRFQTHSDCEVILGLYAAHGDALLERLRGMFAFALWDERRQRLLAARDHLGQKPFFYRCDRGELQFASEIKALLAASDAPPRLEPRALDQYLALRLVAPPLTMFEGISKLPPGHLLSFEPGGRPEIRRYWSLGYEPKREESEQRLLDELEATLTETLRLHMVSDVPVGAYLSGGLDSSLIVAMLSRNVGVRELPTFTVTLPYREYSEGPHAAAVARRFSTQHREVEVQPGLLHLLPEVIWHLDEPSDFLAVCSLMLARVTRPYVKVVLGGDGGDELFGGYDRYFGNLFANRYAHLPAWMRRAASPLIGLVPDGGWYKSPGHRLRWLQQLASLPPARRYAASLAYFHFQQPAREALYDGRFHESLGGWRGEQVIEDAYASARGSDLDRMLAVDSAIRLPDHPVMISDRTSMAAGLETRSPFMDHRLAEFCARLPDRLRIRGRTLRYLQRKLAARFLGPETLRRPKQGFASALPYLLAGELAALQRRVLADAEIVHAGILDASAVTRLLAEQESGRRDHGTRLWLLTNLEIWYRMFVAGRSPAELAVELQVGSGRGGQKSLGTVPV